MTETQRQRLYIGGKCTVILCLWLLHSTLLAAENKQDLQYKQGLGAAQAGNFADAYCIWKPLAYDDHMDAQYSVGWLYANGDGLQVNMDNAIMWWKRAAAQKHAEANFSLGQTYLTGEGVKRDRLEAVRWFIEAAALEHSEARQVLATLARDPNRKVREFVLEIANPAWGITVKKKLRIKVRSANVRQSPSTTAKIIGSIKRGYQVTEVSRNKNWVQISIPPKGQLGWVHNSLLEAHK